MLSPDMRLEEIESKKTNPTNLEASKRQAKHWAKKAQELASQWYDPEADNLLKKLEELEKEENREKKEWFNNFISTLRSDPETRQFADFFDKIWLEKSEQIIKNTEPKNIDELKKALESNPETQEYAKILEEKWLVGLMEYYIEKSDSSDKSESAK